MATKAHGPKAVGRRKLYWSCRYEYVDREGVTRQGKGRTFVIDGVELDLFPSGVLCGILGRSQKTLYQWEKEFHFPQAMYNLADDERKKRWYSRRQLLAIGKLYELFGQLKGENYGRIHEFITSVRNIFYWADIPKEVKDANA